MPEAEWVEEQIERAEAAAGGRQDRGLAEEPL